VEIKTKINKWDLIKLKSFCATKENYKQGEKRAFIWEIIASKITDKELISKICKQLMKLNCRKTHNPMKKWAKDLNRHFSKENILMASKRKDV